MTKIKWPIIHLSDWQKTKIDRAFHTNSDVGSRTLHSSHLSTEIRGIRCKDIRSAKKNRSWSYQFCVHVIFFRTIHPNFHGVLNRKNSWEIDDVWNRTFREACSSPGERNSTSYHEMTRSNKHFMKPSRKHHPKCWPKSTLPLMYVGM